MCTIRDSEKEENDLIFKSQICKWHTYYLNYKVSILINSKHVQTIN